MHCDYSTIRPYHNVRCLPPCSSRECEGDFSGEGDNFSMATEEDIYIICGACAVSKDANTAKKLMVGVVTAGGAAMLTVFYFFYDWFYL